MRSFTGIEVRVSATDQPPGTLHRADGVNTVPQGSLSFGPRWRTAWGKGQLGANIATALAGATPNTVAFVTVAQGSTKFLVAWNVTTNRPRGIWQVEGTGSPNFTSLATVTIAAPSTSVYRDFADGLEWYGSWVQNELWLGNGTDDNLVWAAGALGVLGPTATPASPQNPSQYPYPPCRSFLVGSRGEVYGTGNADESLKVWVSQIPNVSYPLNRGIKTIDYSWVSVQVNATRITALSSMGVDILAHLDIGAPQIIGGYNGDAGGWKAVQIPTVANAGAINPNCGRDTKLATSYLGSDLELYRLETYKGSIVDRQYNGTKWRKPDILTDAGTPQWNAAAMKPASGNDYGLIFDEKNGRTWLWLQMALGAGLDTTKAAFSTDYDQPYGAAYSPDGVLYCSDLNGGRVYSVDEDGNKMDLGLSFSNPAGLAFDTVGNLFVANTGNGTVSKVTPGLTKTTFADDFDTPWGLAFDSAGNLYVSDYGEGTVTKLTPDGTPTELAFAFSNPAGLAVDASDRLYVANSGNGTVSRVVLPAGPLTTFASDYDTPLGLAFDASGNLYVAQSNAGLVSRVTPGGTSTDMAFTFANPIGLAFGPDGSFYVVENGAGLISRISLSGYGTQGVYCFDDRTHAITGPWRYPDFLSFCQLRDENLNGCIVCGITRDGAFLWSDLQTIGDFVAPPFTTALPAACAELSVPPTPNPGIPYVGVSADGQRFMQVLDGVAISMASPWADFEAGSVPCTRWFNNSRIGIIELAETDFSDLSRNKELCTLRSIWNQNSIACIGVYANTGGRLSGGWRGSVYPCTEFIAALGGEATTARIRLVVVTSNDFNAVLSGLNVNYLVGSES